MLCNISLSGLTWSRGHVWCRSKPGAALEFPLPPAMTLAQEPRPTLPPPGQRSGSRQRLCASLRAGFVPLVLERREPHVVEPGAVAGGPAAAAGTESEPQQASEGAVDMEVEGPQASVAAAGVPSQGTEEAAYAARPGLGGGPGTAAAAESAAAPAVPMELAPAGADLSLDPLIGRNSCASDAAATRAPPSGDRSDNDDPGPCSSEKAARGQPAAAGPAAAASDGSAGSGAVGGLDKSSGADQCAATDEAVGHILPAGAGTSAGTGAGTGTDASAGPHDVPAPAAAHVASAVGSEGICSASSKPYTLWAHVPALWFRRS